ncbi:hypothetical protein GLE_0203 [Lysobacter enzymogenes]|uniref:Uncharacterized protein n=1 Tax=Lysobacter enzymogenes TaxID=69 RepID=A0A0S2DAK9_LYSEN|nr:hypothetical protein GLE_0203 [Lysobacter enzymogenes]
MIGLAARAKCRLGDCGRAAARADAAEVTVGGPSGPMLLFQVAAI